MTIEQALLQRSANQCELCKSSDDLQPVEVPPVEHPSSDNHVLLCSTCRDQLNGAAELDANHWRCLNDSMWSTVPAVQVLAWRQLKQLAGEPWAQDLLEMLYLDEETEKWARATAGHEAASPTLDSNGNVLQAGDTVTLIKDLPVKGANFTAKRGTAVRGISLTENPEHIEGRVNGQRIVIISAYVKKSS